MAVTPITFDQFQERFPKFANQEWLFDLLIEEVTSQITDAWDEDDQDIAQLYLMAHLMATEDSEQQISSESFGPISVSYVASKLDGLDSTEYGRRYLRLRLRNVGGAGILVVGGDL